jgi:HlyD family secretion protein
LIIVLLLVVTKFIRYPDIVSSKAKLTSINAPKEVKTKTDGKLVKLMATENEDVAQGQVLGYLESRADHGEVLALSLTVDSLQKMMDENKGENILGLLSQPYQTLGEVQQPYQVFMQSFILFRQYLAKGFYPKKKAMLQGDIGYLQQLHANLLEQKDIEQQDLLLADTTLGMNKRLKDANAIGSLEYRNEKSKYLNKSMTIPQINTNIITNESSQHEKQKEILQLENDIAQQKGIFLQALNTLKAQLDDWKSKYLLIAPIAGKVAFASFFQENQQLKAGETICFINTGNSSYYAEMVIPQYNFGKVAIGQKVLFKFPAYPYQEFGSVYGRVDFISRIPTDSGYLAKVILPQGLATNYQKKIQYRDGLVAQGEIITKDISLLRRFVNTIIGETRKN